TITGKTIAQLDSDFRKYLDVRLAPYAGTFKLPMVGFDDVTKLEIAADASPKDARAKANVALGYLYNNDAEKAEAAAKAALVLDPKQPIARYIEAEFALHNGDTAAAKRYFVGLANDGHDSYDIRTKLAQLAMADGATAEVEKQLCAAKRLDPERSYPYQALATMYKKANQTQKMLSELETYVYLEQMELQPLKQLVVEYGKLANWAKVKTYGEMATFVQPADAEIQMALARAYTELGEGPKALFSYDTVMLMKPRRPALVQIGRARAFVSMKKTAEAKAAIAEALKLEGGNAEALELQKTIK
ncbi:MAG TPA: tetratricopeptide repeat protein, partial [Kofleriaceae bacterium]|nr:tetratricopeptide repeat protein [Kofleriaceae bacterium]